MKQIVGKNVKLQYHFRSGADNDGVAILLWMDSSPVTMMSTVRPLSGENSLVLKIRKHPGNKSTNASGANSTFLPAERHTELDIPVVLVHSRRQLLHGVPSPFMEAHLS